MRPCLNLTTIFQADLEAGISAAAEAGFEAVELWVDSLERYLDSHTTEDLLDLLKTHRMEVLSIGDIESITFCDSGQFKELCERCERLAAVASGISCPTLVASASVRPRDTDEARIADETETVLGRLLDIIEPAGVGLALAFRGFGWCAVNTLEQACAAVDRHSGRPVGLALDTFDLHATGVSSDALKSIDASRVFVVRLSDCEDVPAAVLSETDRALPGEGAAQLEDILQAVRRSGYSGPISLKIPSPKFFGLDAAETAKVVMTVSKPFLPEALVKGQR